MSNQANAASEKNEPTDDMLVTAYLNGSEAALEQLFSRYRKVLYAFVTRMLNGDGMTADDIFQDLWIKVINKLPVYNADGRFAAWIFQIARNQVLEHFRREKSRRNIGATTDDGDLPEQTGDSGNPQSLLAAQELEEKLEELLKKMPAEQREVFIMRQNDLSFREIAEIQKCSINTALGRMHNCIKFLRNNLSL